MKVKLLKREYGLIPKVTLSDGNVIDVRNIIRDGRVETDNVELIDILIHQFRYAIYDLIPDDSSAQFRWIKVWENRSDQDLERELRAPIEQGYKLVSFVKREALFYRDGEAS